MVISFGFKSLNAGVVVSKGPALAVRGTSSSKSTVLISNFTVTEFTEQVLQRFPPLPPKAEKPITMSGLRYVIEQSSLCSFEIPWSLYCSLCHPTLDWQQGEL